VFIPAREPNGRLSRTMNPVDSASPAAVKRLKDAALKGVADEHWGTQLGHLLLDGAITEPLYAAGRRWTETVMAYYRAIGAPPPYPKAISWERYEPGADPDPRSEKGKRIINKAIKAIDEMHDAYGVLRTAGLLAERVVRAVCETNATPQDWAERVALTEGLSVLALFWGLTKQSHGSNVRS